MADNKPNRAPKPAGCTNTQTSFSPFTRQNKRVRDYYGTRKLGNGPEPPV